MSNKSKSHTCHQYCNNPACDVCSQCEVCAHQVEVLRDVVELVGFGLCVIVIVLFCAVWG